MKSLLKAINPDAFEQQTDIDENFIHEFYERNERKKEDEKWLKEHKPLVLKGLEQLNKDKAYFGNYKAAYTVPDNSCFDESRVLDFLMDKNLFEMGTKRVLDEDALTSMIEHGLIDLEELKEEAWVEKKGTPRISVKMVKE